MYYVAIDVEIVNEITPHQEMTCIYLKHLISYDFDVLAAKHKISCVLCVMSMNSTTNQIFMFSFWTLTAQRVSPLLSLTNTTLCKRAHTAAWPRCSLFHATLGRWEIYSDWWFIDDIASICSTSFSIEIPTCANTSC